MTLDEALTDLVEAIHADKVNHLLDPSAWTLENRQEMFNTVFETNLATVGLAIDLIKEHLEKMHDDKPVLWLFLRRYSLHSLIGFWSELRARDDAQPGDIFDGVWLTEQIQTLHKELKEVDAQLAEFDAFNSDIEEL